MVSFAEAEEVADRNGLLMAFCVISVMPGKPCFVRAADSTGMSVRTLGDPGAVRT